MKNGMKKRIERIKRELDIKDKTQWLKLPDPGNSGETIEIKGYQTLAEFLVEAME